MRILMLTPYLPYPPSSGGQVRSYNLIKKLYKKHKITLLCYIRDEKEKKYIPELKMYCKKIIVFKRRPAWSPLNVLLSGITPFPFLVSIYLSRSFRKKVEEELKSEKYDLIHAETFYVMTNIPKTNLPTILVEQTIEYLVYKHFVRQLPFLPLKPILSIDVQKLKFWEKYFWKKADRVVAVSESDKKEMLALVSDLDVDLVPNGVDLEFFRPSEKSNRGKTILFVSNFKWLQNIEAAETLIEEIFPKVKERIPDVKLLIVGQYTPERITRLKKEGVSIVTLKVDDIEGIKVAYQKATIFVSPMKGPGGTRLKNLAAMASRLPIVTTNIGAEGIGVRNGIEAVIKETSEGIAAGIIELLTNHTKAKTLAENARELAENEYSWERMAEKLDKVYQEAAALK